MATTRNANVMKGNLGFDATVTTNAGVILQSLTTTQRNALTPTAGTTIFNTTTGQEETYSGSAWLPGGLVLGTGVGTFLTTPSSANLAAAVTNETGSGSLVFATSPALVTPDIGTPSAGTLTNATGLPISTGVSGLGTGVATFLATPSSANLAAAVTDETGSGALVFGTSPTFTTGITTPAIASALGLAVTTTVRTSGVTPYLTVTAPADTTLTASTEAIGVSFVGATRQHAAGALTTQREYVFAAPTYSFASASTITTAAMVAIAAAPIAGTNATLTNSYALWVQSGTTRFDRAFSSSTPTLILSDTTAGSGPGAFLWLYTPSATDANDRSWGIANNAVAHGDLNFYVSTSNSGIPSSVAITIDKTGKILALNSIVVTQQTTSTVGGIFKAIASRTAQLAQFQTSAAGSLGNVSGGCIDDTFAVVSTTHTDGTFDTLKTTTTVANALIANGDKIYFDYTLTTISSATAARDFKLAFAGITIFDSTGLVFNVGAGTVRIFGYITRASATTCIASISFQPSGSATILAFQSNTFVPTSTLTGLTLTGTNNLVLSAAASGTGAASGDINLQQAVVHIDGFGS